jgi:hypothetical protein
MSPDDTYDVQKYLEMLAKATGEILIHCGYDAKRLEKELKGLEGSSLPAGRQAQQEWTRALKSN